MGGAFCSVENRRLYCLKRYQLHVGRAKEVWVRVRLHRWRELFDRFLLSSQLGLQWKFNACRAGVCVMRAVLHTDCQCHST